MSEPWKKFTLSHTIFRMKVVQEDEELLCTVWARTEDVSGHTILRNGSTQSYINPMLAWDIRRGPVENNITDMSSALGHVEAIFIHKHEVVRDSFPSNAIFLYNRLREHYI